MFIAHLHQRLLYTTIHNWVDEFKWSYIHMWWPRGSLRHVQLRLLRQKSSLKSIIFWLIDMAQFQFCTNNWVWKSNRQDGCCVCSLWTISAISKQCLEMFQCNLDEFLRRFIIVDETWIHTRDKGTIKTMDFIGWTSSEEGEDRKIDQKGDGQFFRMHVV